MTDDEIAAVKARHAADQERRDRNGPYYMVADDMHADRAALLAEVERLRVKNERLRERLLQEQAALVLDEIGAALERERVLRAALTDMLAGWRYIRETYGDLAGIGWDRVEQEARNALEGKL